MNIGDIVKFSHPATSDEVVERFLVRELRGDRVLVEFVCNMTIRPTFVYFAADLTVDTAAPH